MEEIRVEREGKCEWWSWVGGEATRCTGKGEQAEKKRQLKVR